MTPKQKALWGSIVAAITGALSWLANTPPESQDAILGPILSILPVTWRPSIGAATRAISSIATVYVAIQASHSGPATKPATDAQTGQPKIQP